MQQDPQNDADGFCTAARSDGGKWFARASVAICLILSAACGGGNQSAENAPDQPAQAAEIEVDHGSPTAIHSGDDSSIGERLYNTACASCHEDSDSLRIPTLTQLRSMSAAQISFALTSGKMKSQASGLSRDEIGTLVNFIGRNNSSGNNLSADAFCESSDVSLGPTKVGGWGVSLSNARHATQSLTSIDAANVGSLDVAWSFGLPGVSEARSQPVITKDAVFIATMAGDLFALDRASGCIKWHEEIGEPVRAPLSLGTANGEPSLFVSTAAANVLAIRAVDGGTIWRSEAALFPVSMGTSGPVQYQDKLIVPLSSSDVAAAMDPAFECCRAHGAVVALNADTGETIWTAHMTEDAKPTSQSSAGTQQWGPSGAPVWTTPAIDAENGRVYIGTGENTSAPATVTSDAMVALDFETGDRLWAYQATENDTWNMACHPIEKDGPNCPEKEGVDHDFGGAVIFADGSDGRRLVIGGQKAGVVHAVDAETGDLVWKTRVATGSALGGVHWGLSVAEGKVFAPSSDPPYPFPGYKAEPGLTALDLDTGEKLWRHKATRGCRTNFLKHRGNDEAWPECSFFFGFSAAPTSTDDLIFATGLDGRIFAFDGDTGEELWSYDTKRPFETTNGVPAHGGAIDNAGVQLADDMMFVQSGYSLFGQMPGNVLIAFRADEDE